MISPYSLIAALFTTLKIFSSVEVVILLVSAFLYPIDNINYPLLIILLLFAAFCSHHASRQTNNLAITVRVDASPHPPYLWILSAVVNASVALMAREVILEEGIYTLFDDRLFFIIIPLSVYLTILSIIFIWIEYYYIIRL